MYVCTLRDKKKSDNEIFLLLFFASRVRRRRSPRISLSKKFKDGKGWVMSMMMALRAFSISRAHACMRQTFHVSDGAGMHRCISALALERWSTTDAEAKTLGSAHHLVSGEWVPPAHDGERMALIPDPLNANVADMIVVPDPVPSSPTLSRFVSNLRGVPKSGVHNPFKNPERYLMYGRVCLLVAEALRDDKVASYFARLIQRVSPKNKAQAEGEVAITRQFFENFGGDQVRFLARSFGVPGDHYGQMSNGYRFPFGGVCIVTPFNFPLEIPALQLLGALFMGNRPLLKVDSKVSIVMEQFLRLMIACGMPPEDVDLIHCGGETMQGVIEAAEPRTTLFTGSSRVAEALATVLRGKIKVEDAGFDWKIIGPDVAQWKDSDIDYIAYVCDQDAYACTGQKCSAQSILLMHDNMLTMNTGLLEKMEARARMRSLENLTVGPTLSVTTAAMENHVADLLKVDGARVLFGGKPLANHNIPDVYGAFEPTAVFVPLKSILGNNTIFKLATKEIFGPVQVVTTYDDVTDVLEVLERIEAHLTAAVVSNDTQFVRRVLANSVNGTTYVGMRARTTGAPQNHWFGPAGDPRAAGIGSPEAIQVTWSCHREVITDEGPVDAEWNAPPPS